MVVIDLAKKRKGRKCPNCGGIGQEKYKPFCSRRCADLDLAKWLNGSYSVPVVELDENDLDELETTLGNGERLKNQEF
tara:strand:+ start:42 stop:275 length:234 start_codon:yes stop_codon:yes gene_type:complete